MEMMDMAARICLTAMFLYASTVNPFKAEKLKGLMRAKNMPLVDVLFPLSNVLMLASSLAIIFNVFAAFAALYLVIFMMIATYYFADFWKAQGMDRDMRLNQFTGNITIIGGLLFLVMRM
jgi:putative oxidoreductase